MKKHAVVLSVLISCLAIGLLAVEVDPDFTFEPNITITSPAEGAYLRIGSQHTIRWTHNAYFTAADTAHLYLGIGEPIGDAPATQDAFTWTVGRKMDGSFFAPGAYYIDLEAADYQYTPNVNIHLFKIAIVDRLRLKVIDACPNCFTLDTTQLHLELAGLAQVEVELARGGEVLAKLGKFGPGLALPGQVKIVLTEPASGQTVRSGLQNGYELRVRSPQGKIIHQQAVQIETTR